MAAPENQTDILAQLWKPAFAVAGLAAIGAGDDPVCLLEFVQ